MSTNERTDEAPWRAGLRGARATLVPGIILQLTALILVIAYYQSAPAREWVNSLARLHDQLGLIFGIVSTGLCGGLIPFLYLRSRTATRSRFSWAGGAALTAFWAYKGIEVDLWYRVLARTVGADTQVATVATKMVLDQFVYCPLFAVPVTVLLYAWIESGFRLRVVINDAAAGQWYRRKVLPVLISNLGVWVPTVCIIYALPTALQLPLQNLVLCFFTLLLAHVMPGRRAESAALQAATSRSLA